MENFIGWLLLVVVAALVWLAREHAQREAERTDREAARADAELERERRLMERLLEVVAQRSDTVVASDAEVAERMAGYEVPEDLEAPGRVRTGDEVEWLDQWEDAGVRQRWAQFLDRRVGEGRTPNQAMADAELQLQVGRNRPVAAEDSPRIEIGSLPTMP